ncbi:MAG TPA: hypothetical protein VK034_01900 [Enhygromyxa sp.]|nr:hypothetical protein [Enhygromyxa sp.]
MARLPRRLFLGRAAALCMPSLLVGRTPIADAAGPSVAETLADLEALSQRLVTGRIDADGWQTEVEAIFARTSASELLAAITLDWKALHEQTRRAGQITHPLDPSELHGCPATPSFRRKLFSFSRDRAILPHAHRNIVSAFVVLAGSFRGRHFDRVREQSDALIIRPTDDRSFQPGDAAAISDQRDNVHWFTALDDQALLFNVSVTIPEPLRGPGPKSTGRVYLDPDGERLEDDLIRAPRASLSQLRAKYER